MYRPETTTPAFGQGLTAEDLFPRNDRNGYYFNNPIRAPRTSALPGENDFLAYIMNDQEARAQELFNYAINNSSNGAINLDGSIFGIGQTQANPPGTPAIPNRSPSAPASGNPFAAAARNAGLSDFSNQQSQAAALRASGGNDNG